MRTKNNWWMNFRLMDPNDGGGDGGLSPDELTAIGSAGDEGELEGAPETPPSDDPSSPATESGVGGENVPAQPAATPPEGGTPAPSPTPATPAVPPQVPPPTPDPQSPQPSPQAPSGTPAPQTGSEPQKPAEPDFAAHRAEFLPKLEQLYQLTQEEADAMRADPAQALPQLAAKLHYEVMLGTHNAIASILPQMIQMQMTHVNAAKEHEQAFYARWPELKDAKHQDTVVQSIASFRAANPKATAQEVIEKAGLMAMLILNLDPRAQQQQSLQNTETASGVNPLQAAAQVPNLPARPAGVAGAGHVQVPNAPQNGGGNGDFLQELYESMLDDQ